MLKLQSKRLATIFLSVNPTNQVSLNRTLQAKAVDATWPPPRPVQHQETRRQCHATFLTGLNQCFNYCSNTIPSLLIRWSRVRISPDPPYRIRLCGRCPTNPRHTSIINPLVFATNPYRYWVSRRSINRTLYGFYCIVGLVLWGGIEPGSRMADPT